MANVHSQCLLVHTAHRPYSNATKCDTVAGLQLTVIFVAPRWPAKAPPAAAAAAAAAAALLRRRCGRAAAFAALFPPRG